MSHTPSNTIENSPILSTHTTPLGRQYATTASGHHYTKTPTQPWTLIHPPPTHTPTLPPLQLLLIIETQSADEPNHWSLLLAHENQPGTTYQVTGDAECMFHSTIFNSNPITSAEAFQTAFVLADNLSEEQGKVIEKVCGRTRAPKARNAREVKENRQTWCVRVCVGLKGKGVVGEGKVGDVAGMVGDVRGRGVRVDVETGEVMLIEG